MAHSTTICTFVIISIFFVLPLWGQTKKPVFITRDFQISLVPGVGTNGLNSAQYFNRISLNLAAGISAGNSGLEVGIISSSSLFRVRGIQFAGVANVVGTNSFIVEPDTKMKSRDEDQFIANFYGLQFSGIINYVHENTKGGQFSGLFNVTRKSLEGIQLSGLGNTAGGPTTGVQFAGLYNLSGETMSGIQASLFLNVTRGIFSGTQAGLINKVESTGGKNSVPPTRSRGLQVGLLNLNREMNGLQIGVVNIGGKARGVQFGLINFYKVVPSKENVKQGIPVGLLNFGSRGPRLRAYNSEMFAATIEYTSGQCRNCSAAQSEMPFEGKNQIYYHNSIIVSSNPSKDILAFGYGFQRMMFNKASISLSPDNKKRMLAYGLRFRYLHRQDHNNSFNLLSSINFDYGKRFGSIYSYAALTLNHFVSDGSLSGMLPSWNTTIHKNDKGNSQAVWPGYSLGFVF